MKRPCKHIEAGSKDNGTGLCWACGANHRASLQLTDMDEAFKIADELRAKRQAREIAQKTKTFDRLLEFAKKLP